MKSCCAAGPWVRQGLVPSHVDVPARRLVCGEAEIHSVNVDVERGAAKVRGQAQVAGLETGRLSHVAQRRLEQGAVAGLDEASWDLGQAVRLSADVQDAPVAVDHHGAARDVPG